MEEQGGRRSKDGEWKNGMQEGRGGVANWRKERGVRRGDDNPAHTYTRPKIHSLEYLDAQILLHFPHDLHRVVGHQMGILSSRRSQLV